MVLHGGRTAEKANQQVAWRLRQSASSLREPNDYCQKRNLNLALEDMLGHLLGGRTEELEWMLAQLSGQGAGSCLDTGHIFLARSLLRRVRLSGSRLVMMHAHDNWGAYDGHLPPGEGKIGRRSLLDTLEEVGFQGEIVLEIGEESNMNSLLQRARQSALFLQTCSEEKSYSLNLGGI